MTESPLSEREQELLKLVATGASNKEISQELFISINTVKVHLRNIYIKLEVASRTEAAMWAVQNGLVNAGGEIESAVSEESGKYPKTITLMSWFNQQTYLKRFGLILAVTLLLVILSYSVSYLITYESELLPPEVEALVSNLDDERWKQLREIPTARAGLAATTYNNLIYAISGEGESGTVGANEVYNPQTDSWVSLAPKPVPVSNIQAEVIGGQIYIPGGQLGTGEITDILEIYNPHQDTWSYGAKLPSPISAYAMASLEGKLYIFGGWDGRQYVKTVYEYDPGQDLWMERSAMPTARGYAGAETVGSKIFVIGGFNGEDALEVNEVYIPAFDNDNDNAWSNQLPIPKKNYGMGVSNSSGFIFVVGGSNYENLEFHSLNYSNPKLVWDSFTIPIYSGWSRMAVVTIGSKIYILGGEIEGKATNRLVSYTAVYTVALPFVGK